MKFLIIGDLHGNKPEIHFKDFDAIIAPGDFCSDKYERPLWKEWFSYVNKNKKNLKHDFNSFVRKVLKIKKSTLKQYEVKSLKEGRKILKYLNSFNKPVFIVPGNWDKSYLGKEESSKSGKDPFKRYQNIYRMFSAKTTNKILTKGLKNIYDCQFKLYKFKGINIVGYGLSSFPERPPLRKIKSKQQKVKIVKKYQELFHRLVKAYQVKEKKYPTLFLTHNVPYNTKLDVVISKGSYAHNKHYGSQIAREFCKKYQPLVCIGGHIHEHFGKDKLGKTTIINAGFGSYVNTLLEIKENKITKLKFYKKEV